MAKQQQPVPTPQPGKFYNDLDTEAKRLRISSRTLWERCKRNEFPHFKMGALYRFDPEVTDRHVQENMIARDEK